MSAMHAAEDATYSMSGKLHGKVIKYNQISQIATRNSIIDPCRFAHVNDLIGRNKDLLFMPNAIKETHMQNVKYEASRYKIIMWGVLQDGRKATVVLNGIQPYFELKVPQLEDGEEAGDFAEDIFKKLKKQKKMDPVKYEITSGKQFKYYKESLNMYVRIYFDKLTFRAAAIRYVRTLDLETAHDDLTCYYRVICRDKLMSFNSWNVLSNYIIGTDDSIKGSIFYVDVQAGCYTEYAGDISNNSELLRDNSMVMTWDIETYSPDGQLPVPEDPTHKIFMIATTFHWWHSNEALLKVCIVDMPCKPHKDFLTIVCDTEERIIKAFGKMFEKMKPEYVLGFNDSDYDWPWVVTRAYKYPGLLTSLAKCMDATKPWKPYSDADIMEYNYTKDKIKVEADSYVDSRSLQFPGYINIDVRTVFRQLYPTSEKSSLAWFLQANKLGGKKEMPYQEMFKIYRRMLRFVSEEGARPAEEGARPAEEGARAAHSDDEDDNDFALKTRECKTLDDFADRMREVAEYCVIDAQRCQELFKMRNVITEHREVAKVAYTSIYEAFFRANGSKVRNLVIALGQRMGLKISNITDDIQHPEGKYPGAYVFAPRKGLVTSKLTMRERRTKAMNCKSRNVELSGELREWLEISDADMERYEKFIADENVICIDFSEGNAESKRLDTLGPIPKCVKQFFEEKPGRPITGLDFSSLYPSLIMTYNLSPEYIIINKTQARALDAQGVKMNKIKFTMSGTTYRAWSIAHENKTDPASADYKFGIYPKILKDLFDNRKLMQLSLKKWEALKEHMEALPSDEFNTPENLDKYENIKFNFNCINSKQKALKVFMNTFYGETGNKNSPFFLLELAGGITSLGQQNIKAAHRFVADAGCGTWYGDSVTGDTPLLVKHPNGSVDIQTIESVSSDQDWKSYENFKPNEPDRREKSQRHSDLMIWTDSGWADIKRVIRHKTTKKMFRIMTRTGCVDVTEDHSLLTAAGEKIKPTDVKIGTELLHSFPNPNDLGFFDSGFSSDSGFSDVVKSEDVVKSTGGFRKPPHAFEMGQRFAKQFGQIPANILNAPTEIRSAFLAGCRVREDLPAVGMVFRAVGKIAAHGIFYLLKSIGELYVSVELPSDSSPDGSPGGSTDGSTDGFPDGFPDGSTDGTVYIIKTHLSELCEKPNAVCTIDRLPDSDGRFVYDVETSSGRFGAGVGDLVLKNTDSLYLSMPEKHFANVDVMYYSGKMAKIDYWTELVNITFHTINEIRDGVNAWFEQDNGTKYLRMAYEEALFPVIFLAKKKYYGIPHISVPNFNYKHLFVKGLEVLKRGVSQFLRDTCQDIMKVTVSPANLSTLIELIHEKIQDIYANRSYSFDDFIMTDVYKPNKQNVKVQTFAQRMRDRGIKIKPWERFNYVIVKKNPFFYDHRGRKTRIGIGDKMELASVAKEQNMEIDLDYYMEGSINGQLARLIVYHPLFYVEPLDETQDEIDVAEKKIYNNASKYIENFCKPYYTNYQSKGKIYQKVFKIANKTVSDKLKEVYNDKIIVDLLGGNYEIESIEEWLCAKAEKVSIKEATGYGQTYVEDQMRKAGNQPAGADDQQPIDAGKAKTARMKELQNVYFANKENLVKVRETQFKQRQSILLRNIKENLADIKRLFGFSQSLTETLSEKIKTMICIDDRYNSSDNEVPEWDDIPEVKSIDETQLGELIGPSIATLQSNALGKSVATLKFIFINLVSNYTFIHKTRSIVDYLKICRDREANLHLGRGFDKTAFIKASVNGDVGAVPF